jgi:hypothetical protein
LIQLLPGTLDGRGSLRICLARVVLVALIESGKRLLELPVRGVSGSVQPVDLDVSKGPCLINDISGLISARLKVIDERVVLGEIKRRCVQRVLLRPDAEYL